MRKPVALENLSFSGKSKKVDVPRFFLQVIDMQVKSTVNGKNIKKSRNFLQIDINMHFSSP